MNNHSNSNSKIVLTLCQSQLKAPYILSSLQQAIKCMPLFFSCVDEVSKVGKGSELAWPHTTCK